MSTTGPGASARTFWSTRAGRCLAAAGMVGARAVVVQAVDERAAASYAKFGFRAFSGREPLMLILRMSEIEGLLRA